MFSLNLPLALSEEILVAAGEYPPSVSQKLRNYGTSGEILLKACQSAKVSCNFTFFTWARAYNQIKTYQYDVSLVWAKTKKRQKEVLYSKYPVNTSPTTAFYFKNKLPKGFIFKDWNSLKGLNVVGVSSYWYENIYKRLGINAVFTSNSKLALQMLALGRADIYVDRLRTGLAEVKKYIPEKEKNIRKTQKVDDDIHSYLIFPKTNRGKKIKAKLDKALKEIHDSGEYNRLLWLPKDFKAY